MKLLALPFTSVTELQKRLYWKKVKRGLPNECWPWKAALKGKGYGVMTMNKINVGSTRIGWLIVHGFDPYPLHVLHTCDNSICHNPAHWFRGTNQDNCQDKSRKFRNGRKLTPDIVSQIRLFRKEGESQQSIADKFGVNQTLISFICRRVIWSHVK